MKQQSLEKAKATSTLAWFKLAEVVSRGEKERALAMYRLLGHSIQNEALKFQLEGDLLRMFNDDQALTSYYKAVRLYAKNNDWVQVILLYTLMIGIAPHSYEYRQELIKAYILLGDANKAVIATQQFILYCCSVSDYAVALKLVRTASVELSCKISWFLMIARSAATSNCASDIEISKECIKELLAVNFFGDEQNEHGSTQFLLSIQAVNQDVYRYAYELINLA